MRPDEGAGRPLGGDRESAETDDSTEIFAPQLRLGNCVGCAVRIDPRGGTLRCPTCAAWRRWYSAHRVASQALREIAR